MKGISLCGECGFYDWKKHRCTRGASKETDPKDKFYDDCPLPDAEPVVRCKDCKHNNAEKALRKGGIWCEYWGTDPDPDDFCKRGDRRDEA